MKNFLIGMYGGFNQSKYARDFRKGFYGIEASMFPDRYQVELLARKSCEDGFRFGVHYPLIKKDTIYRDPLLISLDAAEREQAFEVFEQEVKYSAEVGACYILTHIPKPVLVGGNVDLRYWRFAGEKEWMFEDKYPYELLERNLNAMFSRVSDMSERYGIQILFENDAMGTVLSRTNLLVELFEKYGRLGMCLDTGRLHFQEITDPGFDSKTFTYKIAPYTRHIHLWNINPVHKPANAHYPVLPAQLPDDGWADVEAYLNIVLKAGNEISILFEHRSDYISDEQLEECYRWIENLVDI